MVVETTMAVVAEEGSFRIPLAKVTLVVVVAKGVAVMEAKITKGEVKPAGTEVVLRTS